MLHALSINSMMKRPQSFIFTYCKKMYFIISFYKQKDFYLIVRIRAEVGRLIVYICLTVPKMSVYSIAIWVPWNSAPGAHF